MDSLPVYCFDTGAFIKPWSVRGNPISYPISVFPSYWRHIDELIEDNRLFSSFEVYNELSKHDDDLLDWVKERKHIFIGDDVETQQEVVFFLEQVSNLYEPETDRSAADPFVVAMAKAKNMTVISNERKRGKKKSLTIHEACVEYGVKSLHTIEMIQQEKWTF